MVGLMPAVLLWKRSASGRAAHRHSHFGVSAAIQDVAILGTNPSVSRIIGKGWLTLQRRETHSSPN